MPKTNIKQTVQIYNIFKKNQLIPLNKFNINSKYINSNKDFKEVIDKNTSFIKLHCYKFCGGNNCTCMHLSKSS